MYDDLMYSMENMLNSLVNGIPNIMKAILFLLLAWIVAIIAKSIFQKGLVKLGVGRALSKTPLVNDEEKGNEVLQSIGNLVYYLVFILFLPAVFGALRMPEVAQPISNMMNQVLNYIPNIIAATIILVIGVFIARLIRNLFRNFFDALNIDSLLRRLNPDKTDFTETQTTLSGVLATIIYVIILIPFITISLEALNIATISNPIEAVLQDVLAMLPNIIVAIVLVVVGYYIGKFLGSLLTKLLIGVGIGKILNSLGFSGTGNKTKFDLAKALGTTVQILILLFFTVEALNVIDLKVLNSIGQAVILYLPFLLSALIILGLGLFFANVAGSWIKKYTNSSLSAILIQGTIIVFAIFMALDQLHFATSIVNSAFLLILGGVMVAFAIAFGIGGREFAKSRLEKLRTKLDNNEENI